MAIRNCKECGKIFAYVGRDICRECLEKEEEDFQIVRDYLQEFPGANVNVVARETEVPTERIIKFLRDQRLEIRGEEGYLLRCESCNEKIPSGRFCRACASRLQGEIGALVGKKEKNKDLTTNGVKFRTTRD